MSTNTITMSPANDARVVVAVGRRLRLGRNATQSEVVAHLREYLTNLVAEEEAIMQREGLVPAAPITPT